MQLEQRVARPVESQCLSSLIRQTSRFIKVNSEILHLAVFDMQKLPRFVNCHNRQVLKNCRTAINKILNELYSTININHLNTCLYCSKLYIARSLKIGIKLAKAEKKSQKHAASNC